MDWRKAMVILIASFIIFNLILLGTMWVRATPSVDTSLTKQQKDEINSILKQKRITVLCDIPKNGQPQAFLEVGNKQFNEQILLSNFFKEEANNLIETKLEGGKSFTSKNAELQVFDKGIIKYINNKSGNSNSYLNVKDAKKIAADYIKSHVGLPKNAVLTNISYEKESKGFLIEYTGQYEGFAIANNKIQIIVTPSYVKSFYHCWLTPYGYEGKERTVISPLTAIMKVKQSQNDNNNELVITSIRQGYYSKIYNSERWKAAPVWIIELKDHTKYYINAYTGQLEE